MDHCRDLRNIRFSVILLCISAFVFSAYAQFGKNKVQYKPLDWKYYQTPRLKVHFHNDCGQMPDLATDWIENAYRELETDFGFVHKKSVPLIIYGSPNLFEQTNIISELIPEGVGGFTELFKNRIAIPFTGSYKELRHVLHHELVHAFQFGILFQNVGGSFMRGAGVQMPLWFAEGLAEYLSSGWDNEADMFLMDRAVSGSIPAPGQALGGYMAYKGGQSFFHFLHSSLGDSLFISFLHAFNHSRRAELSIEKTYRVSLEKLGQEWHRQLKRIYWPEIGRRKDPVEYANNLNQAMQERTRFNLMPRLSPNGKQVAYFSDHKDYTAIVIADTSGKILTTFDQYGYGGYFESFHPFRSGITWSPDSRQIAFVTKSDGVDEIRIVDLERKKLINTLRFDQLRRIAHPDWSPDGKLLVFCALTSDRSDLYLYSFSDSSLTRLTNSLAFEEFPRFSPDARQIVFSLEDTSGVAQRINHTVPYPSRNLCIIDLADSSRVVRQLSSTVWNEKQAVFTHDGSHLVFVSDRNGIDNLYFGHIDSLDFALPLTDCIGGISSPDIAGGDSTLTFSLFAKGRWDVFLMRAPLDSLMPAQLIPTVWTQTRADTTLSFFKPFRYTPNIDSAGQKIVSNSARRRPADETSTIEETLADTLSVLPASDSSRADTLAEVPAVDSAITDTLAVLLSGDSSSADSLANVAFDSLSSQDTALAQADSNSLADSLTQAVSVQVADSGQAADTLTRSTLGHRLALPYRLSFSPDMITFGMGISPSYGYGGTWLVALSDLMGDHRFTFAGDVQGRIQEYSHFFGSYFNTQHRADFGLGLFYSKDYTWFLVSNRAESPSSSTIWRYFHDTNYGGSLMLRFPFSQAIRADLSVYGSHVERRNTPRGGVVRSFDILVPTASVVFDNILWGLTGPVNGMRGKLDITAVPPLESVDAAYVAADFDLRRYFHIARRFVIALRGTAGGSLALKDSDVGRQYFLGGNENWLVAQVNENNAIDNIHNIFYSEFVLPLRGWHYFDLTGSRYALVNTEFRFPFIREISVVWPLPMTVHYINGAVFMDAGNAWDRQDQRSSLPVPSALYGGIGFGMRVNLGIFVLRYDRAWKTDWQTYVKSPVTYFSMGADF